MDRKKEGNGEGDFYAEEMGRVDRKEGDNGEGGFL